MKKLILMSAVALGLAACAEQEAAEDETMDATEDPAPMDDDGDAGNDMGDDGDRGGEDDRTLDGDDAMDGDRGGEDDRI